MPGVLARAEEGPRRSRLEVGRRRPPRHAPPRREDDQRAGCRSCASCRRAYVGVDPVTEPIPVRPVVHYMMGGIHTDINAATPVAGPVRRRRMRLRQHQRRQPARLELARPSCWCSARAPGAMPSTTLSRERAESARRAGHRPGQRRREPRSRRCCKRQAGKRAGRRSPPRDEPRDGGGLRHLPRRGVAAGDLPRRRRRCASRYRDVALEDKSTVLQHRAVPGARARCDARGRRGGRRLGGSSARSRAARTSASTTRSATTRLPEALARLLHANGDPRIEYLDVVDHQVAAGRARVRRRRRRPGRSMSERTIQLEVLRYRSGAGQGADFPDLLGAVRGGVGGPRRAELHQGRDRPHAVATAGPATWPSAAAAA